MLIPDYYGAKEMYEEFVGYDDVDEVVILIKRGVRGIRYEFVRFFNVLNERILATKLDNIFFVKRNIFGNVPRFQRR